MEKKNKNILLLKLWKYNETCCFFRRKIGNFHSNGKATTNISGYYFPFWDGQISHKEVALDFRELNLRLFELTKYWNATLRKPEVLYFCLFTFFGKLPEKRTSNWPHSSGDALRSERLLVGGFSSRRLKLIFFCAWKNNLANIKCISICSIYWWPELKHFLSSLIAFWSQYCPMQRPTFTFCGVKIYPNYFLTTRQVKS